MRLLPFSLPKAICAVLLPMLAGCASSGGSADPAAYAGETCADLNVAIGATSKEITSAAVSRGRIDRLNVPFWLPGGTRAVTALKDRQTRRIEGLEGNLAAMRQARKARCARP